MKQFIAIVAGYTITFLLVFAHNALFEQDRSLQAHDAALLPVSEVFKD